MSGGGDLDVGREAVAQVTAGLRGVIGELKSVGDATGAVQGSGFASMALSGMEAGGAGLAEAFEGFCERWEWGVRALVQDANQLAERLGLSAGLVWEEDRYRAGTFKVAVNALSPTGNPHADEEEIAGQGWGEILTPDAPEYSAASFDRAGEDIARTWQDTGRSVLTEGQGGAQTSRINDFVGVDQAAFERGVDRAVGPAPQAPSGDESGTQAGSGG